MLVFAAFRVFFPYLFIQFIVCIQIIIVSGCDTETILVSTSGKIFKTGILFGNGADGCLVLKKKCVVFLSYAISPALRESDFIRLRVVRQTISF